MPQQPRIILPGGQRLGVLVAEALESGIEHEDAVLRIAGMARLLEGPAALLAITAHETPGAGIDQRRRNLPQPLHVGPRAQAVKAVLAQQRAGAAGPVGRIAKSLITGAPAPGRVCHAHRGHALMQEQAAFGVHQPPLALDPGRIEEPGRLGPSRQHATILTQPRIRWGGCRGRQVFQR